MTSDHTTLITREHPRREPRFGRDRFFIEDRSGGGPTTNFVLRDKARPKVKYDKPNAYGFRDSHEVPATVATFYDKRWAEKICSGLNTWNMQEEK